LRDQWHGMTRTGVLGRLRAHAGAPALEMHPQELTRRHWAPGTLIRVKSRRGAIVLPVQPSDAVAPAQAFVAMHAPQVNWLTGTARCPQSGQPELKHAAVRLEPAALPWALEAAAWLPADEVQAVQQRLAPVLAACAYAEMRPLGHEPDGPVGLAIRLAHNGPGLAPEVLAEALGLADGPVLRYEDPRRGVQRRVRIGADGLLHGFLLVGDTAAAGWLRDWLEQGQPVDGLGRQLLAGSPQPPVARAPAGRAVCSCHGVGESAIVAVLRGTPPGDVAARLACVQGATRAGTACGSCLPALKALVRTVAPVAPDAATAADGTPSARPGAPAPVLS
jgi:assimilatory nitrate reductase catalytic subunit